MNVASYFLEEMDLGTPEVKENISHHMAEVHLSVGVASHDYLEREKRYNYTTPKSFLELISFYKSLLLEKRDEMQVRFSSHTTGPLYSMRSHGK